MTISFPLLSKIKSKFPVSRNIEIPIKIITKGAKIKRQHKRE